MPDIQSTWIPVFDPLLQLGKWRHKVFYGGRGGAKTIAYALAILNLCQTYKLRVLCTREYEKSIGDSVMDTFRGIITKYELNEFIVYRDRIENSYTGSVIKIAGLNKVNVHNIKSVANIDICWVEEAETISQYSMDILIPSIRGTGSEIWWSFNPGRDDDPVYKDMVLDADENTLSVEVNYKDNPYFPDVLRMEMVKCKKRNYSKYLHIWEGQPITNYDSLVYRYVADVNTVKHEIKYNEGQEVWTGWDFGVSDPTSIIFFQMVKCYPTDEFPEGIRIEVFDEYETNNKPASHYREYVDSKNYLIEKHACDPSGINRNNDLGSWVDKLKRNPKTNRIDWHFEYTHKYSIAEMIDHANEWVPYIRYNPNQVPKFHKMMRHWQYKVDSKTDQIVLPPKPLHDEFSHMGTALYYFLINRFPPKQKSKVRVLS